MSYTPTTKSKLSYPPQIFVDSSYTSNYRTNYGGTYNGESYNNSSINNKQLEKCMKEVVSINNLL